MKRKTLKQVRQEANISQAAAAGRLNVNNAILSGYEQGHKTPTLQFMILAEAEFEQPIDWGETASPECRDILLFAVNKLTERYPVKTVLEFLSNATKVDRSRGRSSCSTVSEFLLQSNKVYETSHKLLPTNLNRKRK